MQNEIKKELNNIMIKKCNYREYYNYKSKHIQQY